MLDIFEKWYKRYLFEEESILLLVLLFISIVLLMTIGNVVAPVLASVVLAYLMEGVASRLERLGLPQWAGVAISFVVFVGAFFGIILVLLPLVWQQLVSLAGEMPRMVEQGQHALIGLSEQYPELLSKAQLNQLITMAQAEIAAAGQSVVAFSLNSLTNLYNLMMYMVLVPLLVFFFLKDREQILSWLARFLPSERPLLRQIWGEMNMQISNYARGKALEIIIVGVVSYIAFAWLGLRYAALLAMLVGLSVIIPYIGAALVTIPVAVVGYFQWGMSTEFYTLVIVYLVIQGLDGNVLVPLLFSEAVNLHPVAIILAVLFFGGIWGLWGVFFAIPLATLIKAIIYSWPEPETGGPELPIQEQE
jgi:putative permease